MNSDTWVRGVSGPATHRYGPRLAYKGQIQLIRAQTGNNSATTGPIVMKPTLVCAPASIFVIYALRLTGTKGSWASNSQVRATTHPKQNEYGHKSGRSSVGNDRINMKPPRARSPESLDEDSALRLMGTAGSRPAITLTLRPYSPVLTNMTHVGRNRVLGSNPNRGNLYPL